MALKEDRIYIPEKYRLYDIASKWRAFEPVFVGGGFNSFVNMINGDVPTENDPDHTIPAEDHTGSYVYSPDQGSRIGLIYPYNRYVSNNFTVFMVAEFDASPQPAQALAHLGTVSGSPDNVQFEIRPKSSTLQMQVYTSDVGGSSNTINTGLYYPADEASTISFSAYGSTNVEACINGSEYSSTVANNIVAASAGNLSFFQQPGGGNTSSDAKLYLFALFRNRIPPIVLQELHRNPTDLFEPTRWSLGFKAEGGAPAAFNYPIPLKQTSYRKDKRFV